MKGLPSVAPWASVAFSAGLFALSVSGFKDVKHPRMESEIRVALPLFAQVAMTGGDRFLAANLGAVRAQITDTSNMQRDEYKVLALVQQDAAWLNPYHEDNYYSAAAILPWYGQVDAAQTILRRAAQARYYDYQPSLFYAFHRLHFYRDPVGASAWLRQAAPRLPDEQQRLVMEDLAARWVGKANDLEVAIRIVESMAQQARRKDFQEYLFQRVVRLRGLLALRNAAENYRQKTGNNPQTLQQLVASGILKSLPVDPFGVGFELDAKGIPVVRGERS